ncbi:MAG: ribose 1,5-bisphosphate isomerase [DPANN group archaeon]|nr:ribose 1,5-bisphosphate isomerase [DPANN group archaeon]
MSTYDDIKDLKIQGASEIAKVAIIDLNSYGNHITEVTDKNEFISKIEIHADKLKSARPTEPMLQNCLNTIIRSLKETKSTDIIRIQKELYMHSKSEILKIKDNMQKIVGYGISAIPQHSIILTHCHSHNVANIITKADPIKVFATETRPRFQGRLTAKEIASKGIDTELILDDEVVDIIDQVDIVIIGADAITKEGVVNKVGSRMVAEIAYDHKKPVYVAASTLKIIDKIDIEVRDSDEIWEDAPKKVKIHNYAFDTVPYKHIKKIITENGLVNPKNIKF